MKILVLIFHFSLLVNCQNISSQNNSKIKLTDVEVISLAKDTYTNSRRLPSRPQLKCIGTSWKCQTFSPNTVQCFNRGIDSDYQVIWECIADLDRRVKFGFLKVICENYDNPNDLYILDNSCGLEYTLEAYKSKNLNDYYNNKELYETGKLSNFLTLLIMIIVILAIYKSCTKNRAAPIRRDFNETYAHVVTDASEQYNNPYTSANFPPPPPPYALITNQTSTNKPETVITNTNTNSNNSNNSNNNNNNSQISGLLNGYLNSRRSESPPPSYENNLNQTR